MRSPSLRSALRWYPPLSGGVLATALTAILQLFVFRVTPVRPLDVLVLAWSCLGAFLLAFLTLEARRQLGVRAPAYVAGGAYAAAAGGTALEMLVRWLTGTAQAAGPSWFSLLLVGWPFPLALALAAGLVERRLGGDGRASERESPEP